MRGCWEKTGKAPLGVKWVDINKGDEDKIAVGLSALHEEDPSFQYHVDSELHQTVISGQGELHLQVAMERIKERFNTEMELSAPKIPFRETIRSNGEAKYRHKKQSGGAGQFAEVWMRIFRAKGPSGSDSKRSNAERFSWAIRISFKSARV